MKNRTFLHTKNIGSSLIGFLSFASIIFFYGCEKNRSDIDLSESEIAIFQPTQKIEIINGMLSFDSKLDFDVTKLEMGTADHAALNKWEEQIGIVTPRQIFHQVVLAEDSISNYYSSLPKMEQEYWRSQPEINSEVYEKAMKDGVIKIVKDREDGSEYFDYNYFDKTVTSVVNKQGYVMIAGEIHQYTSNGIKIILDGDFDKVKELEEIEETYIGDNLRVVIYDESPINTRGVISGYDWSVYNNFQYVTDKRRVKVDIEGHSEGYGDPYNNSCANQLNCTFYIRGHAQKKNFWGNWKYDNYYPTLTVDMEWEYQYKDYSCDPNVVIGCGTIQCVKTSVPSYSCAPNPNYVCPTSPYFHNYPNTNNGSYAVTPHGVWQSGDKFFADAFKIQGKIEAYMDGKTFKFSFGY